MFGSGNPSAFRDEENAMRETEYTSVFDSMVFQIPVETGVEIDLRFTFLSQKGTDLG